MLRNRKGQGMVEYGIVVALLVVAVIAALPLINQFLNNAVSKGGSKIEKNVV